MKTKVVITGASGFLGSVLVNYFLKKNFQVIALVRTIPREQSEGIRYSHFILNQQVDESVFRDADCFIHCAYIKADADKAALLNNLEGTRKLLELCTKKNVKKRIFISSMSAKPEQLSVYGQQKIQIEKLYSEPNDLIIRPGLILGNGGLAQSIINQVKKQKFIPLVDGGKQALQTIFIDDLVSVIHRCMENNISGTLTIAEQGSMKLKDFCRYVCKHYSVKPIFVSVPYWLLYNVVNLLSVVGIKLSISTDNLMGLKNLSTVDVTSDIKRMGVPIRDCEESLKIILSA